jgi:hypothetical protein
MEALNLTGFAERICSSDFEPGQSDEGHLEGCPAVEGGGVDNSATALDEAPAIADDEALIVVESIETDPLATNMADIRKVLGDHILIPDEKWEMAAKMHARLKLAKREGWVVASDKPGRILVVMERAFGFFVRTRSLTRKAVEEFGADMEAKFTVGEGVQAGIGKSLPSLCDERFHPQFCRGDHQHTPCFFVEPANRIWHLGEHEGAARACPLSGAVEAKSKEPAPGPAIIEEERKQRRQLAAAAIAGRRRPACACLRLARRSGQGGS